MIEPAHDLAITKQALNALPTVSARRRSVVSPTTDRPRNKFRPCRGTAHYRKSSGTLGKPISDDWQRLQSPYCRTKIEQKLANQV
jgi:hypothetical protein